MRFDFQRNRSFIAYLAIFSVCAVIAGLAPFLLSGADMGEIGRRGFVAAGVLVAAFVASAAAITIVLTVRRQISMPGLLAIVGGAYAIALFGVLTIYPSLPSDLAVWLIVSGLVLLILPLVVSGWWLLIPLGIAAAGVIALLVPDMRQLAGRAGAATTSVQSVVIDTQMHEIHASYYRGFLPRERRGGAIARLDDDFMVALGTGDLFRLHIDTAGSQLEVLPLNIPSPLNEDEFNTSVPPSVDKLKFRVNDLFIRSRGSEKDIYLSHHYWYADRSCFVLRLSHMILRDPAEPGSGWRTVYETSPCLPLKTTGHPFAGHQAGGRIADGQNGTLLMTVGDHEFDGHSDDRNLPQDPDAAYGKVLEIDPETGDASIVSLGHRNPQGLLRDENGRLWSTEHGPRGGDELNLIEAGKDYGWPLATYGISYGGPTWPLNDQQGRHIGFEPPRFAWVPSVGISSLIQVQGSRFPLWQGDLLVSSMRANTLYRMRIVDDRVIFAEPIDVGTRVRDLVLADDGSIVLWTDRGEIVVLTTSTRTSPISTFVRYCSGCHAKSDGTQHGIGPDLAGIGGADAASVQGFDYSDALSASGLNWDDETLDRYLENPQQLVPGTTMSFPGIPDAAERSEVIDYLLR